ncbi:MAG: hypothetical protein CMO43_12835 [Verrucomicrobiales bacterium]|nr:hypothetical protein [Verrucomicrobiales bacterium]
MTALAACRSSGTAPPSQEAVPTIEAQSNVPLPINGVDPQEIIAVSTSGELAAITEPEFMSIEEALDREVIKENEQVISFGHNGDWHAYATLQLDRHEIVNDVVGGLPIAATW